MSSPRTAGTMRALGTTDARKLPSAACTLHLRLPTHASQHILVHTVRGWVLPGTHRLGLFGIHIRPCVLKPLAEQDA